MFKNKYTYLESHHAIGEYITNKSNKNQYKIVQKIKSVVNWCV